MGLSGGTESVWLLYVPPATKRPKVKGFTENDLIVRITKKNQAYTGIVLVKDAPIFVDSGHMYILYCRGLGNI